MSNSVEVVDKEAVISVPAGSSILNSHATFKASELLSKMEAQIGGASKAAWFGDGVDCEILVPGKNWRKGKIKVVLQFFPDEPESQAEADQDSDSASPLDHIRHMMNETSL